ncbi:MAG: acetyl-CoA carboxylase biotin carboxylase subunit [Desulfosarcina sp.]|nr:acetyl-CoA carboxylase biotin carboxylase subunit [Desulfosarcina sp.]MBC2743425.1 acetyl-CoA carboxylase biotin carboxylase subunit [Desulfosarcina sp.]MBC2766335.1 acetyl-CoA carboxylase biotin carboxylase subunit [Desulfosarcina sp.]
MFKKILIANRGEIALRIIRACKEMGIGTIAVFSDADARSLHVKYADEAVNIGPPLSRKSYLNIDNIIQAAKSSGAEAIHPGYGFLSENQSFALACADNNIVFIGPPHEALLVAGNKASARKVLSSLGIAVIPGSDGIVSSPQEAASIAGRVGYPVIIKASGGGGGRGMRLAHNPEELAAFFSVASGEARAAFGNPDIYIEKYITAPRHIEIQILGDQYGNYVHLGERECSIQKRYQKLIEESPSSCVDRSLREKMGATAIAVAQAIGYSNAGTVEFLLDGKGNYYFMEVNARLQVEHPVTELVTGIDLVWQQIRISSGEALSLTQKDITRKGWAIECRINAADPDDNFMPSPGVISDLTLPGGPGVRVDTHIFLNYEVSPFYDSLIGKLIVLGEDRKMAIHRMQRALSEFRIGGIKVTIPFHEKILQNKDFISGNIDTYFLDRFETTG